MDWCWCIVNYKLAKRMLRTRQISTECTVGCFVLYTIYVDCWNIHIVQLKKKSFRLAKKKSLGKKKIRKHLIEHFFRSTPLGSFSWIKQLESGLSGWDGSKKTNWLNRKKKVWLNRRCIVTKKKMEKKKNRRKLVNY